MSDDTIPAPVFGRTAGGLLAARVGDSIYALMSGRAGSYLAHGHATERPLSLLSPSDFSRYAGSLADEDAFRAAVAEQHQHQLERARLGRRVVDIRVATPWGGATSSTVYGLGVRRHETARHGGFEVDQGQNHLVHEALRKPDGFYEEDCEWAAVTHAFPDLFTTHERRHAQEMIRSLWPSVWSRLYEVVRRAEPLPPPP